MLLKNVLKSVTLNCNLYHKIEMMYGVHHQIDTTLLIAITLLCIFN